MSPPELGARPVHRAPLLAPLLAIETSTTVARVAVVDAVTGTVLAGAEAAAERHSSNLLRLCAEATEKAGATISALGAIACGAGPGSFTGLRVAFAVAKGLAMPTGLPLVLVSSLEALAMDLAPVAAAGEWILPCLDAGKGQVYAAVYRPLDGGGVTRELADWASDPEAVPPSLPPAGRVLCGGPGAVRYRDPLLGGLGARGRLAEVAGPSAVSVAARALQKLRAGEIADLDGAVPSYGRAPDITRPKR